jgi:pyruvate-formate lyase-activating enzyme
VEKTPCLQSIMEQRYTFYRTALFMMTRECPLRCRHCSIEAGPDHHECMPIDRIDAWVKGVSETGTVDILAVSGGEPFVRLDVLGEIFTCANRHGLKALVVTSGIWAAGIARAKKVLDSLPEFFALEISADEFHEEFIPLERIRDAAAAAVEKGIQVIIGLVQYRDAGFKDRLYTKLGHDLLKEVEFLENTVKPLGRAQKNRLVSPGQEEKLPTGSCRLLAAPVVRYDGRVMACCNDSLVYADDHCLWLGDLNNESFADIHRKAQESILIQALRTIGPKGIVDIALEEGWDWKPRHYDKGNICDLCRDIIFSPSLLSRFDAYMKDEAHRHEIIMARFFKYGEVMPA